MIESIKKHPLLSILIIAGTLRLFAVIFSQGFMAHDDHFETVRIAWAWHNEGIFLDDSTLRWEGKPDVGPGRNALYNLFLLGTMKISSVFGVEHLDQHMYFDRLIHALLSLLPIIFGYKYLREETDENTALVGGLILGAHFMMPFFAVRNLIEMVGADFLVPALYFAHRSMKNSSYRDALLAAILSAIAFMLRFPVAAALIAVPIAILISKRDWRRAGIYCVSLVAAIGILDLLDIVTHGRYLGSLYVLTHVTGSATLVGPWYRYLLLILGIMIPPFSIMFLGSMFQREAIRKHLVMLLPALMFVLIHSMIPNKQERFMIPIMPVLIILGCAGMSYFYRAKAYVKWRKLVIGLWIWFIVINTILLIPFTLNYAHRGLVDSMVYLSRQDDVDGVVFDCTARKKWLSYSYWDYRKPNAVKLTPKYDLDDAIQSADISLSSPPSYIVVYIDGYPDDQLAAYGSQLGKYEVVYHAEPSLIDLILHLMNPKYNHKNEAWVLKNVK